MPNNRPAAPGCGVLITNLGTPDSCKVGDVRRFLREFLGDRRVVELPRLLWWLILNVAVLSTRPRQSARAYAQIWGADGSPLLSIARRQQHKLRQRLADGGFGGVGVELGMRYGHPSIASALAKLRAGGARRLLVLPLYPQYCAATTASALDAVYAELSRWRALPGLRLLTSYHDNRGYIAALAASVRDYRRVHPIAEGGMLLMSFHGLPQACVDAGDPYADECRQTARLLAAALGLRDDEWRQTFQSRFGRRPWLQPYTDETLLALAKSGVSHVHMICPGFSADCLETLHEIDLENRDIFMRAGGENYGYIPCLNAQDAHIDALAGLIVDNMRGWGDGGDGGDGGVNAGDARLERAPMVVEK